MTETPTAPAADTTAPIMTRIAGVIQPRFVASTKSRMMPRAVTAPPTIEKPRGPRRSRSRASSATPRRGGLGGAAGWAARGTTAAWATRGWVGAAWGAPRAGAEYVACHVDELEDTYAPPPGQAELVAALRAGDEQAFAALVAELGPSMLRSPGCTCRRRAVAEEVVQETWLGVLSGIGRFEGRSSLKTWIFRILTNRAKTRGEREGRSLPFSSLAAGDADDDEPSVDADRSTAAAATRGTGRRRPSRWSELPESRLVGKETIGVAQAAIDALPETQRAVITLRDVDGWSSEEVRNVLGLSESNQESCSTAPARRSGGRSRPIWKAIVHDRHLATHPWQERSPS